ncbi:L,D-transpeptidase family protein [Moraxella pluranimalium]|uniref:L,D-TPase catalytic domain-containing protein n=1 Tax=Moraxella pluranimalium TaxID=470453 RepID=A0A1T0CUE2_9GAMM|nr:L,D-transpeptidase family protein [Moraxella pluranimalium]OOS25953.1 hypothetical protein B0680_00920 [Moraxella pluranimalium]
MSKAYLSPLGFALMATSIFTVSACDKVASVGTDSESKEQVTTEKANDSNLDNAQSVEVEKPAVVLDPNTSQQFRGDSEIDKRLAEALPEIPYSIDNLTQDANAVNTAEWLPPVAPSAPATNSSDATINSAGQSNGQDSQASPDVSNNQQLATNQSAVNQIKTNEIANTNELTRDQIIKIQALLNWHHHSVGAVDGKFSKNTIKAMNVFQEKHGLQVTETMNAETWAELTKDVTLSKQPVLVSYTLTAEDVSLPRHPKGQQFKTVREAVAEKFHMSQDLLSQLNKDKSLKAGVTITVYNPGQPNTAAVTRVVANKKLNILYAYDASGQLVASYPTTVGGGRKPSPTGKHTVTSRIIHPTYNKNFRNKNGVLPPGPNNPVGRVWMGLSKPTYGIHGSPEPEMISQQQSSGCVRLTNWDALGLYGVIQEGAEVEFL